MTIRQWMEQNFSEFDVAQIVDFTNWCDVEISKATLMSTPYLQFTCSGDCIISFKPVSVTRRPIWLIRDNNAAHEWEYEERQNVERASLNLPPARLPINKPKPHAMLRLVQTASPVVAIAQT